MLSFSFAFQLAIAFPPDFAYARMRRALKRYPKPKTNWKARGFSRRACSSFLLSARHANGVAPIPAIAQLVEHLTVDCCSNQMVPGSIPGGRIFPPRSNTRRQALLHHWRFTACKFYVKNGMAKPPCQISAMRTRAIPARVLHFVLELATTIILENRSQLRKELQRRSGRAAK